jgi:hypothetical protein
MSDVTRILSQIEQGDPQAAEQLAKAGGYQVDQGKARADAP